MHFMNCAYVIGKLEAKTQIFSSGKNERLAKFTLLTPIDGINVSDSEHFQKHHILIKESSWIDYAQNYLIEGRFVFVKGQLNQIARDFGRSWIVISSSFGALHLIGSQERFPKSFSRLYPQPNIVRSILASKKNVVLPA
ncbi:MAG: hypothetical protein ABFQ95_03465 [Pseudomonadota bacterium]